MQTLDLKLIGRGKVRDIYEYDARHLVFVTSNRVSAFDVVLPTPIPNKGATLNSLTRFWMNKFTPLCGNHIADGDHSGFAREFAASLSATEPGQVEVVKRAEMLQVECVVRGFITGSGWKDYKKSGSVCGHRLPEGLEHCAQFPEPLFTPATKAETGHDENIDFARMCDIVGLEMGTKLRDLSLEIYSKGRDFARERGILIADTKFEFGVIDGELCLCDEVLTPDSSRFWPADEYQPGRDQRSFDKQIVRNYLETLAWDKTPPGPELPQEIVQKTAAAYKEISDKLTV
ncbi:MAG: phosphoribosylaminoimidazolesuccinocarboxamide synthase [Calditrichaeota bacterium]|nr:phosphoribosylaminoimidazolesuccinocarboxamide synthase [Calditrichota bacterium]MCB9365615.1 phosphoribosylaminoimidazolesuccinocarboxamide synthase [Calditrichota bacterium]